MTTAYLNSSCNHAYLRQSDFTLGWHHHGYFWPKEEKKKKTKMFWEVYDLMFRVVDGLHQNK